MSFMPSASVYHDCTPTSTHSGPANRHNSRRCHLCSAAKHRCKDGILMISTISHRRKKRRYTVPFEITCQYSISIAVLLPDRIDDNPVQLSNPSNSTTKEREQKVYTPVFYFFRRAVCLEASYDCLEEHMGHGVG